MSCDCHVIWGQSLLVVFSFFCERESRLGWGEGDHRHQCGSVEVEGEREKGREEGSTCMYARSTCIHCTSTPKHMHIFTCTYVCIMQCPCGWVSVVAMVMWDQRDTSSHCFL